MANEQVWSTRSIFVCSTFLDMQAERDYLRDVVFPELAERLRKRRQYIEPIDLRWGVETVSVDEEHEKELLVLTVCLSEIERSRPFFIGLLGDRYGWIPPEERMQAAVQEAGYSCEVTGKSVTALEIEFGVLNASGKRHCFFYFRDPLPYNEIPLELASCYSERHNTAPGASAAAERLVSLKERLTKQLRGRVRHYSAGWDKQRQAVIGLEEFGRQVLEDIWDELNKETRKFAITLPSTWQEQERLALEEFVALKSRDFVGREEFAEQLRSLLFGVGEQSGVCITGEAGAGKSALFAYLYKILQTDTTKIVSKKNFLSYLRNIFKKRISKGPIVLAHAAGIGIRSTSVDTMLRRWVEELASHSGAGIELSEKSSSKEAEEAFLSLLKRIAALTRVVLLVDALDQFEPTGRAKNLTWLPDPLPGNVRFIATTIADIHSQTLASRKGVILRELPHLTCLEAEAIVHRICHRYHRKIHPDIVTAILDRKIPDKTPAWGNPLWLNLAVERLNQLDADDYARADREFTGNADQRLQRLLLMIIASLPLDIEGMYEWILERTEEIFGRERAFTFANLIAISRNGWREGDLRALLPIITGQPWDAVGFARLRRGFLGHLLQRGQKSQWDFAHLQLRKAIIRRNLTEPDRYRRLHTAIVGHLESLPRKDGLRQSELMFHIIGTGDAHRAAQYYTGNLTDSELNYSTQSLIAHIISSDEQDSSSNLLWVNSLLAQAGLSDAQRVMLADRYIFSIVEANKYDIGISARLLFMTSVRDALSDLVYHSPDNLEWQWELSFACGQLGDALQEQGNIKAALQQYERACAILKHLTEQDGNQIAWQRDFAVILAKTAAFLSLQGDMSKTLEAYKQTLNTHQRLAVRTNDKGQLIQLRVDEAQVHRYMAEALYEKSDFNGALRELKTAYIIGAQALKTAAIKNERLVGSGQMYEFLVSVKNRASAILVYLGDIEAAQVELEEACRIILEQQRIDSSDPSFLFELHDLNLMSGRAFMAQEKHPEALNASREALTYAERLSAKDPNNMPWKQNEALCHEQVGLILASMKEGDAALEEFRQALNIYKSLGDLDLSVPTYFFREAVIHTYIADVLEKKRDLDRALEEYHTAVTIVTRLLQTDKDNAEWNRLLSRSEIGVGDILKQRGDLVAALSSYRHGLSLRERLLEIYPNHPSCLDDLADNCFTIAELLHKQGDLTGALEACQRGLLARKHLAKLQPKMYRVQYDLSRDHIWVGSVLEAQGDVRGALDSYRQAVASLEEVIAHKFAKTNLYHDFLNTQIRIGDLLNKEEDHVGALCAYQKAMNEFERFATNEMASCEDQIELGECCIKIGDLFKGQNNAISAMENYQKAVMLMKNAVEREPSSNEWQRSLGVAYSRIADALKDQKDLAGTEDILTRSLNIIERIVRADPKNALYQRELAVAQYTLGDVLRDQGNLVAALTIYQKAKSGLGYLVSLEPNNADWLRHLYITHNRIGGVLQTQGDLDGARKAYDAELALTNRLTLLDPGNDTWQRDLSWSHGRIGRLLEVRGDFAGSIQQFRAAIEIFQRLVDRKPDNLEWRYEIAKNYVAFGDVLKKSGDLDKALDVYRQGRNAIQPHQSQITGKPDYLYVLAVIHERIAGILKSRNDLREAQCAFNASEGILKDLSRQDPKNPNWQEQLEAVRKNRGKL